MVAVVTVSHMQHVFLLKKNLNAFRLSVLRPFLSRKFFQENLGLEGSNNFLGKFRQVHNLKISDRLSRSKSFFQEVFPGFICSVFRSA